MPFLYGIGTFLAGLLLVATTSTTSLFGGGPGTINQLSPFVVSGSQVRVASTTADFRIPSLDSCDTIDTDGNGVLSCGTDGGGGGAGASTTLLADSNTFSGNNTFSNTITGAITGNAGSATVLQTSRNINGVAFNGSANITINAASSTLLSDNNTFTNTITGSITGNAGTASALAANGANCSAGNYPLGVNASGAVEDCTAVSGGSTFPFTATANYNSTSTPIGFLAGLFSNSSTTLNGTVQIGENIDINSNYLSIAYPTTLNLISDTAQDGLIENRNTSSHTWSLPNIDGWFIVGPETPTVSSLYYAGSNGSAKQVATSSASCAGGTSCSAFTVVGSVAPVIRSFSYPFPSDATTTRLTFDDGLALSTGDSLYFQGPGDSNWRTYVDGTLNTLFLQISGAPGDDQGTSDPERSICLGSNDGDTCVLQIDPYNASTTATGRFSTGYASTTAITATAVCLSTDCRTTWPSAGSSFEYPFPSNATSTELIFNDGLISTASTTINARFELPSLSVGGLGVDGLGKVFSTPTTTFSGGLTYLNGNVTSDLGTSVDISSETNLSGDTEIVLTGDALSIASTITRDTELHNAVTLAGEDYLSLSTQQITANAIDPDNLSASDFGAFTCNGTNCSLDTTFENPLTFTWPLIRSTNTITFGGLSTSSPIAAASGLLYATGVNTVASISTSSAINLSITGTAGQALSLAENGDNCAAGSYPLGVDPAGVAEDCTPTFAYPFPSNATTTLLSFNGGASTTLFSANYASSTLYYGAGLADCNTGNMLTWTAGRFGCEDDTSGGGGGASDFTFANNYGVLTAATSSPLWAQGALYASSSVTVDSASYLFVQTITDLLGAASISLENNTISMGGDSISLGGPGYSFSITAPGFTFENTEGKTSLFDFDSVTDARTFTFPDATGTVCLTTTCAGFAYPFPSNATTTLIDFQGGLKSASTTLTGPFVFANATGTNATTTNLYVSGTTILGALTGVLKATSGVVTAALLGVADLATADFGDWSCNGSACTIDANAIALTTDTTGNYVESITGTANQISVTNGSGAEDLDATLALATHVIFGAGGYESTIGSTTHATSTNLSIGGFLNIGGDYLDELVGDGLDVLSGDLIFDCSDVASTGITCSGEDITASLGTAITSSEITDNEIVNADINSSAAISSSKLATTYGDALTITGDDVDFDGGTAPSGELGGTWGAITIDDGVTVTNWALGTIASGIGTALTALNGENIQDDTIDDDSIDFTDVTLADITFDVGSVDTTEFGYLNGVTSAIQTQLSLLGTIAGQVWTGVHDFGGAVFELTNGTAPTVDAVGEIAIDTTSNNLILATSTNATSVVLASASSTLAWFAIGSTTLSSGGKVLASGGFQQVEATFLPIVVTGVICHVESGTSVVVNISNIAGSSDSNTFTCTSSTAQYPITSNNSFAAYAAWRTEIGTVTGSVDLLHLRFVGYRKTD